jgi:hypothetical protein
MEVLTKILQQGTEFDTLAETVLADRFEQLVQLATMISDKGELPIAMALANVVTTSQMVSTYINRNCFGCVTLCEMEIFVILLDKLFVLRDTVCILTLVLLVFVTNLFYLCNVLISG